MNPELREHYLALKDKGKKTRHAYIAIGNRVLRLAFAMMRDGEFYRSQDPAYSLKSQIKRKLSTKKACQQFYAQYVVQNAELVS